ncbi:MAG: hypothetical protein BGO26_18615 [Actinobacteria bacterium 69-20]|jgi:hypothetical protein|nr:MAG: hypothetical protein BGO26_18615 [Actinobacteria bacterium 69-20]
MSESMADDRLRLLLYRGTGGDTVPLSEYLDQHRRGEADWTPYLGMVALDLTVGGESLWPSRVGMGDLARWTLQMGSASDRLRRGEPALVRIAVDDAPVGGFFLMRPDTDVVRISVVDVTDPDMAYRYPVDHQGMPVTDVYECVEAAAAEATDQDPTEADLPRFRDIPFPRERLIEDLAGEARRGRELYDELGVNFYVELY